MDMPVSVIIPNWNGRTLLEKCLKSLELVEYRNLEVIVVDNNSEDDSVKFIQSNYPKVKIINLNWNTGFSYAVNRGIEKSNGAYIALLNNDTEVEKYWLSNALNAFNNYKDIGIVTSKLINYYDRDKIDAAGDEMNIVGQAKSRGYGEQSKMRDKGEYVFLATGGASIYKKELFEKVGLLEETYYMYFEDADLSYRAQRYGYKIWFEPSAIVYHMHRASSNKRKEMLDYLLYRNFIIFYLINTPWQLFLTRKSLIKFILVVVHTFYFLAKHGKIKPAARTLYWIVTHPLKLYNLRKDRQRILNVSLDYIERWRQEKEIKIFGYKY